MRRVHISHLAAFLAAFSLCCGQTAVLADTNWRLDGPYTQDNLSIFIVRGANTGPHDNVLTLDEALKQKYVTVFETGIVGELSIENHSDYPVFIQAGSIVKGGQQDRVVRDDQLLMARSGKLPLPSFCVESGRWSGRENENVAKFESSTKMLPSTKLKRAAMVQKSQDQVWKNVAEFQIRLAPSVRGGRASDVRYTTSLQMSMETDAVKEAAETPRKALQSKIVLGDDAIGMVCAIGGECVNADLYDSPKLFAQYFPKLLEAAVLESLTEKNDTHPAGILTREKVLSWLETSRPVKSVVRNTNAGVLMIIEDSNAKTSCETFLPGDSTKWIHKNILVVK